MPSAAPPKLFDLTSLQREANRIFGYTAKQTLDLAQALYEKKLLTKAHMVVFFFLEMGNSRVPVNQHFQRRGLDAPHIQGTDSTYLTDDRGETAASTAAMLCGKLAFMEGAEFSPDVSREWRGGRKPVYYQGRGKRRGKTPRPP